MRHTLLLLPLLLTACSNDTFASSDDGGIEASPSDALVGETSSDGPSPALDARADSGDASIIGPFSCNPPPANSIFCDTFDGVTSADKGWTSPFTIGGGTVTLDTTNFVSVPQSAHVSTPIAPSGFVEAALLYEDINASYQTMSARTSVFVSAVDVSNDIPLLRLSYESTNATIGLLGNNVVLEYTDTEVDGGVVGQTLATYVSGKWFDIELDLKQGPTGKVTATVNGKVSVFTPSFAAPLGTVRDVVLGISEDGSTTAMSIDFDDFDYAGF